MTVEALSSSAEGPTDARRRRTEARRAQVIEAARDSFVTSGFEGASMAQIALAAGMSVGQIYRYFSNKEAVVAAIVEEGVAARVADIATVETAARENGQDIVAAYARLHGPDSGGLTRSQTSLLAEMLAEAARNPTVACIVERGDRIVRERAELMVAAARPHWPPSRVRNVVHAIAALKDGWALRAIADPSADAYRAEALKSAMIACVLED